MGNYEEEYLAKKADEVRVRRNVHRAFRVGAVLLGTSLLLFIAAIIMESGKTAGVAGVIIGASIVTLVGAVSYSEAKDY